MTRQKMQFPTRIQKAFALVLIALLTTMPTFSFADSLRLAPEFTNTNSAEWINSPPLQLHKDLRGQVVMVEFWTYTCWNCYRSFPWLKAMEKRLENEPFTIVAVHSPEFAREKVLTNVMERVKHFGLTHPVVLDNDFSYWRKMNNRYWPAFYLIDKQGHIRGRFIGETHEGDANARGMEKAIRKLLAET